MKIFTKSSRDRFKKGKRSLQGSPPPLKNHCI